MVAAYRHRPPHPPDTMAILRRLIVDEPQSVLDAGTGLGELARELAPDCERVDAVDFSEGMIEAARSLPGGDNPRMWTPPGGQARIQSGLVAVWSGTVVCAASWCSACWLRARMVFVRSDPNRIDGLRGPPWVTGFSDPVSLTVCPYPVLSSCCHTSRAAPRLSFPSFRRPLRRQREPCRSPSVWPAPRPFAPSGWRGPPRPPSSACVPTSRPATGPCPRRRGSRAGQPSWLP